MRSDIARIVAALLVTISLSGCARRTSIVQARESTLKDDLFTMRQALDEYTFDKKHAPQSLDDLVQAGYLKEIPKDPFTGKADWEIDPEDPGHSTDPNQPGIADVHSSSSLAASDGTAYRTW